MANGFIYVLKNPHMPSLVKIGYTERSPDVRAIELSQHTGVPGNFSVVKSWLVKDAATYEKRIFTALTAHRKAGEHFQLSPAAAVERINVLLRTWGQIGDDGLTVAEQAKAAEARRRAAEWQREQEQEARQTARVKVVRDELEDAHFKARHQAWKACAPLRKRNGIIWVLIWSSICGALLFLTNSRHQDEVLKLWLFVAPVVWFFASGLGAEGKEDSLKKSIYEPARQRILAKHGLPPTWTPPIT